VDRKLGATIESRRMNDCVLDVIAFLLSDCTS
jgi:hypothetical protein